MPNRRKDSQRDMVLHSSTTRLPPEVLARIFHFYLPSSDERMFASPSAQRTSCLAQVCRPWKTIVESDPHLWTSIHFYFPSHTPSTCEEDARRMRAILDLHFKRSGTLPLSLTFRDHRSLSDSNKGLISFLANILREHSRRWKHISIHLPCNYFSLLFAFTPCDLSSLEHLHISSNNGQSVFHVPRLSLDSATNLKSFSNSGSYSPLIDTVDLQWDRLVEVSFDFVPWNQSLLCQQFTHLGDCQNVAICSLGIDEICSLPTRQTITLFHLQILRIRRLSSQADTRLLEFLFLPRLETLEIDSRFLVGFDRPYTPWQDRIFSNLLAQSGCALRHLLIQDVDFSNEELVRCLALSPTLTSLRFIPYPRSQDIEDVIRNLDVSPATTVVGNQTQIQEHRQTDAGTDLLVPGLRKLTLGTERDGSLDSIMAMLHSRGDARTRAAGVAALRCVEVILFRKPRSPYLLRPRFKLKKMERFRRKLAQWASEVDENANDEISGGVVAKVGMRSTATVMTRIA